MWQIIHHEEFIAVISQFFLIIIERENRKISLYLRTVLS